MIVYNVDLVVNNSEYENLIKMLQRNIVHVFQFIQGTHFPEKNTIFSH